MARQSNIEILNAARLEGTNLYQQLVPQATQNNIAQTVDAILELPGPVYNTLLSNLVNRIGTSVIHQLNYKSPLRSFKRPGILPYGSMVQEIAVGLVKARSYDPKYTDFLTLHEQEVYQALHQINRADVYEISINRVEFRQAFVNDTGLNDLIVAKLESLNNSAERDEFNITKELIARQWNKSGFFTVSAPFANEAAPTPQELVYLNQILREYIELVGLTLSGNYNSANVPTSTDKSKLRLIVTAKVKAAMESSVLANAFQLPYAKFDADTIVIDKFPVPGMHALLIDEAAFVIGDTVNELHDFFNIANLTTNITLHKQGVWSFSPFVTAIAFGNFATSDIPEIDVTLTGLDAAFVDDDGATVTEFTLDETPQLVVKGIGTVDPANPTVIVPDAYKAEVTVTGATKTTKTYINRFGRLRTQQNLPAGATVTVKVTSVAINPETGEAATPPITDTVTLTVVDGDEG